MAAVTDCRGVILRVEMESWIGQKAAEFKLEDTFGREHTSTNSFGRWQLLVFHRQLG